MTNIYAQSGSKVIYINNILFWILFYNLWLLINLREMYYTLVPIGLYFCIHACFNYYNHRPYN